MKKLIITADDFGNSSIYNAKILEFIEKGFVTATSVMLKKNLADQPDQAEHLAKFRKSLDIAIGLHFDLNNKSGEMTHEQITEEIKSQYDDFIKYIGLEPDYIDKHKDIYTDTEAKAMVDFANSKGMAVRNTRSGMMKPYKDMIKMPDQVFMCTFTPHEDTIDFINNLEDGISYELISHPGEYDPNSTSTLNADREKDCEILTKIQDIIKEKNIQLINHNDL